LSNIVKVLYNLDNTTVPNIFNIVNNLDTLNSNTLEVSKKIEGISFPVEPIQNLNSNPILVYNTLHCVLVFGVICASISYFYYWVEFYGLTNYFIFKPILLHYSYAIKGLSILSWGDYDTI